MNQKMALNYPSQFALLLALLGVGIILGNIIVLAVGAWLMHVPLTDVPQLMMSKQHTDMAKFLNTMASFLVFFIPSLILAWIMNKKPFNFLGLHTRLSSKQIVLVIMLAFAGLVLSGALGEVNQLIPLPSKWMAQAKELEQKYKEAMTSMVAMKNFSDYLISLLVLALAPALFEEILFRGGFQQIFVGWTKSPFAGILITSIVFSAIHFSYFGFLPRAALGMILGYVFYYSKNLWLNIIIHFIYNGLAVTQIYVITRQGKSIEKAMDENMPIWLGVFAIMACYFLLKQFKKASAEEQAIRATILNENGGQ
ncbi:MAG: CPBP family intramembrane metalloprotease [Chitinophagaceae bacterium]|nr:CPBP family intramembrane metalloprotease [Chitinophagaceae bacterium]